MTSPASPLTGGCLCGAIRYSASAPITALRACHCTHCQKSSGTGATVNAVMPTASFTLTSFSRREASPERTVVRAGSLDNPPAVTITANIWTRSARAWSWIDPATEQHPANPPA